MTTKKKNTKNSDSSESRSFNAFSVKVFQERLDIDQKLKQSGSRQIHQPTSAENERIMGIAHFLSQLSSEVQIQYPHGNFDLLVDSAVCPATVYALLTGVYCREFVEAIEVYIEPNDKVLDMGAGIGVSTLMAGLTTQEKVVAVEPDGVNAHVLSQNCALNKVKVKVLEKAWVAGHTTGKVSFHLPEEYWSDSVFATRYEEGECSVKVSALNLGKVVKDEGINTLLVSIPDLSLELMESVPFEEIDTMVLDAHVSLLEEDELAAIITCCVQNGLPLVDIKGTAFVFQKEKKEE